MSDFQIPGPEGSACNPEYDGVVEREITCRLEGELSGSKKKYSIFHSSRGVALAYCQKV